MTHVREEALGRPLRVLPLEERLADPVGEVVRRPLRRRGSVDEAHREVPAFRFLEGVDARRDGDDSSSLAFGM
jgi:hypothetical protein